MDMNTTPNSDITVVITDSLSDKIAEVIATLTGLNSVFTAYDITKQIRIENPTMNVPHTEVKNIIIEEYKNTFCDEYECTLTELTVGQYAYVYHPESVSPLTHPLVVKHNTTPVNDVDSDLTVENRLNIGKDFLGRMNLTVGKLVKVSTTNGVMSVEPTTDTSGDTLVVNAEVVSV